MNSKNLLDMVLSVILVIAVMVMTITFSIGLPIYFRPFYYMQIEPLGIVHDTGYEKAQIIEAYNEVLNYLTLPGGEFSAGVFKFSDEGASHFADCKGLFTLNLVAFLISGAVLVALLILHKREKMRLLKPLGFNLLFYSGVATLSLFLTIGALAAMNFDRAFVVFHSILFPGKDNWIFDPRKDEIIRAMPQEFFMNCAILIGASIIIISLALVAAGIFNRFKQIKK